MPQISGEVMAAVAGLAALVLASLYGLRHAAREQPSLAAGLVKTLSVALLSAALFLALPKGATIWAGHGIALGLVLGAMGDFFLSRPGTRAFLSGMGAFAAGHLAYVAAFVAAPPGPVWPGGGGWAVLAGLLLLVASTEVWLAPRTGALRGPVRAYVGVIGLMGAAAVFLPPGPAQPWLQAGAALFLLSDLLLALRIFVVASPGAQARLSRLLWPAYWVGQAALATGGWHLAGA